MPLIYILDNIIWATFTILGGYVAAKMAKGKELKHSIFAGILAMGSSLLIVFLEKSVYSRELKNILIYQMPIIPLSLLGGYLHIKLKSKSNA